MTVSLGVWVDKSLEGSIRQIEEMKNLSLRYPSKYIDSIIVGNEALFRQDFTEEELITHITAVKDFLNAHNISIPVGTSDIGSKWNSNLASVVDVLAANIHPFFGGVPVNMSTSWYEKTKTTLLFFFISDAIYIFYCFRTYQFLYEQVLQDIDTWDHVPEKILISEVGWPSGGGHIWGSVAGMEELQKFLDDWVCSKEATESIGWYWFEAFDEPWKEIYHNGEDKWETQWGLFNSNRELKQGIKLPKC